MLNYDYLVDVFANYNLQLNVSRMVLLKPLRTTTPSHPQPQLPEPSTSPRTYIGTIMGTLGGHSTFKHDIFPQILSAYFIAFIILFYFKLSSISIKIKVAKCKIQDNPTLQ